MLPFDCLVLVTQPRTKCLYYYPSFCMRGLTLFSDDLPTSHSQEMQTTKQCYQVFFCVAFSIEEMTFFGYFIKNLTELS